MTPTKKTSPEMEVIESVTRTTESKGSKRKASVIVQEQEANPMKRRLRPRKPAEPDVVIMDVRPSPKGRKKTQAAKKTALTRRLLPKYEEPQQDTGGRPAKNGQVLIELEETTDIQTKTGHNSVAPIEIASTDEEEL